MEYLKDPRFSGVSTVVKKRRSATSRRPWPDPQLALYDRNPYLPSSLSSSDTRAKFSAEVKDLLMQNSSSFANINRNPQAFEQSGGSDWNGASNKHKSNESNSNHSDGNVLALSAPTANLDSNSTYQNDSVGNNGNDCTTHVSSTKKLRVRLKIGGVTQTLNGKSDSFGKGGSFAKASMPLDPFQDQQQPISLGVSTYDSDAPNVVSSPSTKRIRKKSRRVWESSDADYVGHKECSSVKSVPAVRLEPLTTRQRALQSGLCGAGSSSVEFPNGLAPETSKKQTERLSEEEKLAKKAEAARRRKIQMEKSAEESQAKVLRKILGVNSDKKAEKEGVRADRAKAVGSDALSKKVRLVMGPSGTVVIFPEDVALPSIFYSKPCSYPPPRERCAGPSCTNPYKYRDSRSNLPLCSLLCYRAVQGSTHSVTTC